jgi:ribonuclease HI
MAEEPQGAQHSAVELQIVRYRAVLAVRQNSSDGRLWRWSAIAVHDRTGGVIQASDAETAVLEALVALHGEWLRLTPLDIAVDLSQSSRFWQLDVSTALSGLSVRPVRRKYDGKLLDEARKAIGEAKPDEGHTSSSAENPGPQAQTWQVATDGSVRGSFTGWGWMATNGMFGLLGFRNDLRLIGADAVAVAEIRAIGDAIRRIPAAKLEIYTDSRRAIELIQEWQEGGDRLPAGYTTARRPGKIAGLVRIQELVGSNASRVSVHWVRGHSGHLLNEGADSLAKMARRHAERLDGRTTAQLHTHAADLAEAFLRAHSQSTESTSQNTSADRRR